jgi:uncharacterized repeat protein (TIGR03803 family)
VQAGDGNLYGAASSGGAYDAGTLFRITTYGVLIPLYTNNGSAVQYGMGAPSTRLTLAGDGNLYGTIFSSFNSAPGEVFSLNTNGTYTTVYSFSGSYAANPNGVIQASDGSLYGTTESDDGEGWGVLFRLTTSGAFATLYTFSEAQAYPDSQLVLASDGNLYGTTSGYMGDGEVFRITTNGVETGIYQFTGVFDGAWVSALVQGRDGYLYGTTDSGGAGNRGAIFRIDTNAGPGAFTLLGVFPSANTGEYPDGNYPYGGFVQGRDGSLYGTTPSGGATDGGTAFRIDTNGNFSVICSLTNGAGPSALVQADDGTLYGTSLGIGAHGGIFRVTTNGAYGTAYSFTGGTDGSDPFCLAKGSGGTLFGTASFGGASDSGTIFQITTNGIFTLLYTFTNGNDGIGPWGLIEATDGNFYGVAYSGGAGSNGTIYQVMTNGVLNVLHAFTGGDDGSEPWRASLFATNGYVYGTTLYGGAALGRAGTVFRATTSGTLTTLYSFTGGIDGNNPTGLAQGSDGNLYGTTQAGGTLASGTVFQISTNGTFSVIHNFDEAGSDGSQPLGSLLGASDGNIYGTAQTGGGVLGGFGTIFRVVISPSNAPLPALQFPTLSAGNFSFAFQAAAGQSYFIQQNTNLATTNWTFFTNLVGAGSFVQLSVPATNTAQFFRLREP